MKAKSVIDAERWFRFCFDRTWVVCRSCRKEFIKAMVARKNKCPNCGRDNYGMRSSNWDERQVCPAPVDRADSNEGSES